MVAQIRTRTRTGTAATVTVAIAAVVLNLVALPGPAFAFCICDGVQRPYVVGGACNAKAWERQYILELFGLLNCPGCCVPGDWLKASKIVPCRGPRAARVDTEDVATNDVAIIGGGGRRKLLSVGPERGKPGKPGHLSHWEAGRVGDRMLVRIEALEANREETLEMVKQAGAAIEVTRGIASTSTDPKSLMALQNKLVMQVGSLEVMQSGMDREDARLARLRREYDQLRAWHAEQRRAGDDAGASTDPHASTHALAAAFAAAHPPLPGRTDAADRSAATDTDADAADTDGGEQTGEDEHANPRVMVQRDVPDEDVAAPGWKKVKSVDGGGMPGTTAITSSGNDVSPEAVATVWETCADEHAFCSCLGKVRFGPKAGYPGVAVEKNSPFGKVECGTIFFDQDPAPDSPKFCECCPQCTSVTGTRNRFGRGVAGPAETPDAAVDKRGFLPCADEHEHCVCDGTIQYGPRDGNTGTGAHTVESAVPLGATSVLCENPAFGGDPAPGMAKRCLCRPHGSPHIDGADDHVDIKRTAAVDKADQHASDAGEGVGGGEDWHHCAVEHELCKCNGGVRYGAVHPALGAPRAAATATSAGHILCENAQFGGDPAPGSPKHCECNGKISDAPLLSPSGGNIDVILFMSGGNGKAGTNDAKTQKRLRDSMECYPEASILVHLSDEHCGFPGMWQLYPRFKLVLRQYACHRQYAGLYDIHRNVQVIPLGYGAGTMPDGVTSVAAAQSRHKAISDNETASKWAWSFAGSMKQDRQEAINTLAEVHPHPAKTSWEIGEVSALYSASSFVPVGRGNSNLDCFRVYEAAINGAIPVVVSDNPGEIEATFGHFESYVPLVHAENWRAAKTLVLGMLAAPDLVRNRQLLMLRWWVRELNAVETSICHVLGLPPRPQSILLPSNSLTIV